MTRGPALGPSTAKSGEKVMPMAKMTVKEWVKEGEKQILQALQGGLDAAGLPFKVMSEKPPYLGHRVWLVLHLKDE